MKIKQVPILALMFCMGALFLPMTAHAAAPDDKTPPTVSARLDGDTLHAEASDRDSGVEAVYVNGHRIGFLVDGAVEVDLDDIDTDGEHITVHAVDFAGNKSREVKLENPYYTTPAATSTPTPVQTTPAPTPTPSAQGTTPQASTSGTSTQTPAATSQPSTTPPVSTSTPEPDPVPDPDPTESSIPDSESNPFTPDGAGSVLDNASEADGKEFFTIVTEAENTFYLIVDRQRDNDGVYLLNAVTEDDLMALAETSGNTSTETVIPEPVLFPEPEPTPEPEPVPEPEPEPESGGGMGTILFIVIAALAVGGAGYYFKIMKPRQQAAFTNEDDDDEPDDYGEYDDPDDDDYDYSDEHTDILDDHGSDEAREDGDTQ